MTQDTPGQIQFPAPDPSRKGLLGIKRPFAQQFNGWQGTLMGGALAAAMVIGYLAGQAGAPIPSPETVSVLQDAEGNASVIVEAYANRTVRVLPMAAIEVPAGKTLVLRSGDAVLGLLPGGVESRLQGIELPLVQAGLLYEITAEIPEDIGASSSKPDVLFSGRSVRPPK